MTTKRPNVLFVFTDQLRHTAMGCYGNEIVRTPNLDRFASQGVLFEQAFSSCPVCSPYRGQILTGNYSHVNGVIDNEYRFFDDQRTLAHRLGEHGYRTAYIGKWHLGYGPFTPEKRYGFDDMMAYNNGHDYYNISYHHNEGGPFPMDDYAPFVEAQLTMDWIGEHVRTNPDQPFCTVLSWGPPHWKSAHGSDAYRPYPDQYRIYDPAEMDVPDNVPIQFRDFAAREIADYYGLTTSIDDCFGRLMQKLHELGIADDTIVCFSSDHGDHLSSHGCCKPGELWIHPTLRLSKCSPYEESIHVPCLLRYPKRVASGQRSDTLFNSVDVLPTLMGLCGVGTPDDVQGIDLSHAVLGEAGPEPDSAYLQILGPAWPNRTKMIGLWRGIRTHKYTYARWYDRDGMRMLFDNDADPLQMTSLADDPAYADVAEQLEARLKRWIEQTNDPFDSGERFGETEMLNVGQALTTKVWHDHLPPVYGKAIEGNYANFRTGEQVTSD